MMATPSLAPGLPVGPGPHWLTTTDADPAVLTPVMRQVVEAKRSHPDALILFRLGDFYELFFEDALEGSRLMDLALTSRNKADPRPIPMCGFPHHGLAGQVQRILEAGRRAAVVEQLEDASQAKGLVLRGVTHLVTPGVVLDPGALDQMRSHHVVALAQGRNGALGVAVADASTGDLRLTEVLHPTALAVVLARLEPRELLCPQEVQPWLDGVPAARGLPRAVRPLPAGVGKDTAPTDAALALLRAYLGEVRPGALDLLGPPQPLDTVTHMALGREAILHLELLHTARSGRRQGALLHAVDRTRTAAGGRLLRSLLLAPLADRRAIELRHAAVAALHDDRPVRQALRERLQPLADVARLATRAVVAISTPRELGNLRDTLLALPEIRNELRRLRDAVALTGLTQDLHGADDLAQRLQAALCDQPAQLVADGGVIRPGFDAELDDVHGLCQDSQAWLSRFELDERASTRIATLKVGYNRVTGYGIEIGRSREADVPAHYHRKQTLKNTERYTTDALVAFERRLATADADRIARETELFRGLVQEVAAVAPDLRRIAAALAELDVHVGFAEAAAEKGWCRPHLVDTPVLRLVGSRHPVVEAMLAPGAFVPNDLWLQGEPGQVLDRDGKTLETTGDLLDPAQILLLTGPNMAGKSTFMRQAALAAILAQAGSFVPADQAVLGVLDAVHTRIGAGDDIAEGASTFMVEMRETALLLERATPRSLVLLDEIGRGTSTWDGLAIAWAVVESLHDRARSLCLFATHYHELTGLAERLPRLRNAHVAVREWRDDIVFVHRVQPGPTSRSHGIAVARLAGLPPEVVARARLLLEQLEKSGQLVMGEARPRRQLGLFDAPMPFPASAPVPVPLSPDPQLLAMLQELAACDPDDLSPRAAHARLAELVTRAAAVLVATRLAMPDP